MIQGYILLATVMIVLRLTSPIAHLVAPKAGSGPSLHTLETGMFEAQVFGFGESAEHKERVVMCQVVGKGDPGYRLASRMIGEAAVCLALKEDQEWSKQGGVLTPASALGSPYVERLSKAGITFSIHQTE